MAAPTAIPGILGAIPDVVINDHGEHTPDSGTGTTTLTWNSKTSTGSSRSYLLVTWYVGTGSTRQISTVSWGADTDETIEHQYHGNVTTDTHGAGIVSFDGAQTGNIVITFTGIIQNARITILSTDDEYAGTEDTGRDFGSSPTTVTDLDPPSPGGARFAVLNATTAATALGFSNATEIADLNAGAYRHGAATDADTNSDDISVTHGGTGNMVAISVR